MSDEPKSTGPRARDVLRHVKAALVMRARAFAAGNADRRAQCEAEADRLIGIARDLAQADDDAAAFEDRVRAGGGVWFPSDGR